MPGWIMCLLLLLSASLEARGGCLRRHLPRRAFDFVNSIGVNTHFGYYDTTYGLYEKVLRPRLLELGVKHIRDGTFNADVARKYREVGQAGIRLLLITSAEHVAGQAEAIGPMLWGVEAVNEPDGRGGEWVDAARTEQRRLYETVKGGAATRHLAVVGVSLANIRDNPARLGDVSQWMDYGGMHPYAAGQYPSRHWGWGMSMEAALNEARRVSGERPLLATECGYHNKEDNSNHPGVSERAAAIYHLHLFFIYFNRGVERCYKYEFLDLRPDDGMTDMECHFGLVRADGTVKPSFTAIRNLLRILSDESWSSSEALRILRPLIYTSAEPLPKTLTAPSSADNPGMRFSRSLPVPACSKTLPCTVVTWASPFNRTLGRLARTVTSPSICASSCNARVPMSAPATSLYNVV